MQQVSESFIMQAYTHACPSWKEKIKKEFPQLFMPSYKKGDRVLHNPTKRVYIISKLYGGAFVLVDVGTGGVFNKAVQLRDTSIDSLSVADFNAVVLGRGSEFIGLKDPQGRGMWQPV